MKSFKYILILVLFLGFLYFFWADALNLFSNFLRNEELFSKKSLEVTVEEIKKEISSPPPLRATKESSESFLTKSGIIAWTNIQRNNLGLPPLTENKQLDTTALMKVKDMFENQYFAHDSPSGVTMVDLAESTGYRFIAIGENLALGNFENDKVVVQAWMDSPGHRANILSKKYTEIGVAVIKGTFEGEITWIAVQEFGLPLSTCPEPSSLLKEEIKHNGAELYKIEQELATARQKLQKIQPKWGSEYNRLVNEYNTLVGQYNTLSQATKNLIDQYNSQIREFNACINI
ncbi:MAG: hypothetical protein A2Z78_01785 [Candidatus Nealsonbacteria bacterium RBG_13_36_15]|uniref:SCP domain-containing protein n=1 Tax=Candidatus Nealsonbacteria bacterium RBG_13_36_15 TaxID=1801660 RepID=A0A1G2DWL8_9BACT|nr:MAG: hypothetical protein A2Z78_01785 [Candidatus Nealsonbacteria bacterium RBG_13_36_15]